MGNILHFFSKKSPTKSVLREFHCKSFAVISIKMKNFLPPVDFQFVLFAASLLYTSCSLPHACNTFSISRFSFRTIVRRISVRGENPNALSLAPTGALCKTCATYEKIALMIDVGSSFLLQLRLLFHKWMYQSSPLQKGASSWSRSDLRESVCFVFES